MSAQPEPLPEHQAPHSPRSVCWLADLRAHGHVVAALLHPITDASRQPVEVDVERRAH